VAKELLLPPSPSGANIELAAGCKNRQNQYKIEQQYQDDYARDANAIGKTQ